MSDLRTKLSIAVEDLTIRSLKISARWASEQLLGMSPNLEDASADLPLYENHNRLPANERDIIHFSNLLISNGEYQRCAHLLRLRRANSTLNSSIGIFLMAYSLYLAGEKIKDQLQVEKLGDLHGHPNSILLSWFLVNLFFLGTNQTAYNGEPVSNPFLKEIFNLLYPLYTEPHSLTSPPMDGFLLYIFGIVVRDLRLCGGGSVGDAVYNMGYTSPDGREYPALVPNAYSILFESVRLYPLNWSVFIMLLLLFLSLSHPFLPYHSGLAGLTSLLHIPTPTPSPR
jgi:hypothetical protein